MESSRNPVDEESVCGSLGVSGAVDCGSVENPFRAFTDDLGHPVQSFTIRNVVTIGGDSGSPYFHRIGATEDVEAIGVHDGYAVFGGITYRYAARLQDALDDWNNTTVYKDPD